MSAEPYYDSWSAQRPALIAAGQSDYQAGYIVTPHGVVGLYEQGGARPHTSFDFVFAGRTHRVSWERQFSDRYKKTLALRFAADTTNTEHRV